MRIKFVEIQNFRKLKSVRIDFSDKTTVFVGANNSGKTSAMVALRHFLIEQERGCFTINDFTHCHWSKLNEIGKSWEESNLSSDAEGQAVAKWNPILPSLDVWLEVSEHEVHHVSHLLPTLDWQPGPLGIRLRLEPKDIKVFNKEYIEARQAAKEILKAAAEKKDLEEENYTVSLWPADMREFLERKIDKLFTVRSYILDPSQCALPKNGMASPQALPKGSLPLDGNPFKKIIRIDKVDASRGFSNLSGGENSRHERKGRLSEQLQAYYQTHIDPLDMPDTKDIDALEAIYKAQQEFNQKLKHGFKDKFEELEALGYPGITEPRLTLSTKINLLDGLNHPAALQYSVSSESDEHAINTHCLPEQSNGLGYQNLIFMVFELMSSRDAWMQVGKAGKKAASNGDIEFPPLHLVLVEEPEAHLHAQVQQVFINEAYKILRRHPDLRENTTLSTQLIISTHSSHIAHECKFSCLRYFRRQHDENSKQAPIATVVNLSEVFGRNDETERFITRYLKLTHCDLFFADAAILVEGPAERMLVPYFIRYHFPNTLNQRYITLLEINGSHAHRLKSLIDHLDLTTLIITDMDAKDKEGNKQQPIRNQGLMTRNQTLKDWVPGLPSVDELWDPNVKKTKNSVRVAYQCPIKIIIPKKNIEGEAIANTFEDALVFENMAIFKNLDGTGLIAKFKDAIGSSDSVTSLAEKLSTSLEKGDKAKFALDLLYDLPDTSFALTDFTTAEIDELQVLMGETCQTLKALLATTNHQAVSLTHEEICQIQKTLAQINHEKARNLSEKLVSAKLLAPTYIQEGLNWLEKQLTRQEEALTQQTILIKEPELA
jgi:predicted ATP-dependent endonuclease of OLD family